MSSEPFRVTDIETRERVSGTCESAEFEGGQTRADCVLPAGFDGRQEHPPALPPRIFGTGSRDPAFSRPPWISRCDALRATPRAPKAGLMTSSRSAPSPRAVGGPESPHRPGGARPGRQSARRRELLMSVVEGARESLDCASGSTLTSQPRLTEPRHRSVRKQLRLTHTYLPLQPAQRPSALTPSAPAPAEPVSHDGLGVPRALAGECFPHASQVVDPEDQVLRVVRGEVTVRKKCTPFVSQPHRMPMEK